MPRSDETLPDPPERGDLDTHDRTCRRIADARDVEVLAVDHRRAPRHPYPAAIEDVAAVLRWAPRRRWRATARAGRRTRRPRVRCATKATPTPIDWRRPART
ncbi:alpha/beta hydrolase fold domain-containing protein [Nonomuraea thailandensis]